MDINSNQLNKLFHTLFSSILSIVYIVGYFFVLFTTLFIIFIVFLNVLHNSISIVYRCRKLIFFLFPCWKDWKISFISIIHTMPINFMDSHWKWKNELDQLILFHFLWLTDFYPKRNFSTLQIVFLFTQICCCEKKNVWLCLVYRACIKIS